MAFAFSLKSAVSTIKTNTGHSLKIPPPFLCVTDVELYVARVKLAANPSGKAKQILNEQTAPPPLLGLLVEKDIFRAFSSGQYLICIKMRNKGLNTSIMEFQAVVGTGLYSFLLYRNEDL